MTLENLKSFDEYLDESVFDGYDDIYEDEDDDNLIYHDGELVEAVAPRLTAKQRQKAQDISQLMTALNKREAYITAKEKFVKVFQKEAKAAVRELKLSPAVLKKMEKVTLREI